MRLPQGEAGEGEGASPPLKLDLSLSQRECQAREGEGTRHLLNLHLSQREYQVKPPKLDRPPSSSSTEITAPGRGETQREYQVKPPKLDHPPGGSSSQEIPVHHPGGQLA